MATIAPDLVQTMSRYAAARAAPRSNRLASLTGLLGVAWIVGLVLVGGATYPGYSHTVQFVSELGARGAPHATVVNLAGFLPAGILICAFALLAWRSLPRSTPASLGFLGLFLYAIGYVGAGFFPCDAGCRPEQPSVTHMLHTSIGLAGYLLAPLTLLLLAQAARRWPAAGALKLLGLIGAPVAFIGLLGLSPEVPVAGLAQRALETSVLLWTATCAWYLRHT